jgi:hypothetical protein
MSDTKGLTEDATLLDEAYAMKFNWEGFGHDLKAYRERRNIGLREFCRSTPINKSTWCRAEQGKPIQVPQFVFLCELMCRRPISYAISAPRPR